MIIDLEKHPVADQPAFDVCIAGAGAAGISLAAELAVHGCRVALLEGGGAQFESRSQSLYFGASDGLPFTGLYNGRCRVLGGTTTQWGGQMLEIDPHVFGVRPGLAGGQWPYPKAELLAAYGRALQLAGLDDGSEEPSATWGRLGFPAPELGDDIASAFSRWCPITDFHALHRDLLRNHRNVTVFLHANLCALDFFPDATSVRSLRVRTLTGREAEFRASHFVLATGGIETCRLLLQPNFSPGPAPWADSGLVGRHFQDHITAFVANVRDGSSQLGRQFDYQIANGLRYHPKIKLHPATQARLGLLDVCGTIALTTDGIDDLARAYETYRLWKSRQLKSLTPARSVHFIRHLPKLLRQKFPHLALGSAHSRGVSYKLCVHCEQLPDGAGRLTLDTDRDSLGLLRARVSWRTSAAELRTIRMFAQIVRLAIESRGLAEVVPNADIEDDDALVSTFRESYHHLGGTRMSQRQSDGIVDPHLRVHGTANLHICSTSVFPSAGFANPTLTLIALAVRLADRLAADLRGASLTLNRPVEVDTTG